MKTAYRILVALMIIGSSVYPQGLPTEAANEPVKRDDRTTAALTGNDNFLAALGAVDRLANAKDYKALCDILSGFSNDQSIMSHAVASAHDAIVDTLLHASDDVPLVTESLHAYLHKLNSHELVGDSTRAGQYVISKRIGERLSRVLGVSSEGVNYFSIESVAQFLAKVDVIIAGRTSGDAPRSNPMLPRKIDGEPTRNSKEQQEGANHRLASAPVEPIAGARTFPFMLGWLAVAVGAVGLFWLIMKSRRS